MNEFTTISEVKLTDIKGGNIGDAIFEGMIGPFFPTTVAHAPSTKKHRKK